MYEQLFSKWKANSNQMWYHFICGVLQVHWIRINWKRNAYVWILFKSENIKEPLALQTNECNCEPHFYPQTTASIIFSEFSTSIRGSIEYVLLPNRTKNIGTAGGLTAIYMNFTSELWWYCHIKCAVHCDIANVFETTIFHAMTFNYSTFGRKAGNHRNMANVQLICYQCFSTHLCTQPDWRHVNDWT